MEAKTSLLRYCELQLPDPSDPENPDLSRFEATPQAIVLCQIMEKVERADPEGWKFADGVFRMVSNADFMDLASAVRQHVRDCFALEAAVLAQIEAGTINEYSQIDAAFD